MQSSSFVFIRVHFHVTSNFRLIFEINPWYLLDMKEIGGLGTQEKREQTGDKLYSSAVNQLITQIYTF